MDDRPSRFMNRNGRPPEAQMPPAAQEPPEAEEPPIPPELPELEAPSTLRDEEAPRRDRRGDEA
jgi:hypothetical protein